MSIKGVRQMQKLLVRYSDYDGSSRGVKDWMRNHLVSFAAANPEVEIITELKRNKHPFLKGFYRNENTKVITVKNLDSDEIQSYAMQLRNQCGRRVS